jgi:hypothetical protein
MKIAIRMFCAGLAAAALAGCANKKVTYGDVTGNPSPELQSLTQTPKEYHNDFALSSSTNLRMFWDDLAHVFYSNSPSRLSPFPITTTGGQPR